MTGKEIFEDIKSRRNEILAICAKHGAQNVRVFGSVARGEARVDSDVDFLVDMEPGRTLFDLIGLEQELGDYLNRKVDIVTTDGINPYLRKYILADAKAA